MRVVCLSDTHSQHARVEVPSGDLLVITGDFTKRGTPDQIADFDAWLGELPHRHKVVIAGNHDFLFERDPARARSLLTHAVYLQDEGVVIEGLRVWGSPWQPRFFDWAFNLDRGEALRAVWEKIPADTQILLTHGPPHQILDRCFDDREVGCEELRRAVIALRPRLHVFGHIHESHGTAELEGITFVNASICTRSYAPTQQPIVVDL